MSTAGGEGGAGGLGGDLAHRVLVVDDNEDSADTLAALLEVLGCEVRAVYSGAQALEVGATFEPTAIVLDIGMPGMSGFEVARRVREAQWGSSVRLVAMTGWSRAEDREQTRAAGFHAHVVKPVDPTVLTAALGSPPRRA